MTTLTSADFDNAKTDMDALSNIVNGDKNTTVTTRLGGEKPSVSKEIANAMTTISDLESQVETASDRAKSVIAETASSVSDRADDVITETLQKINESGEGWLAGAESAAASATQSNTESKAARDTTETYQSTAMRYRDEARSARDQAAAIALDGEEGLFWPFVQLAAEQALRQFEFNERLKIQETNLL